jgi:hypothetical protein
LLLAEELHLSFSTLTTLQRLIDKPKLSSRNDQHINAPSKIPATHLTGQPHHHDGRPAFTQAALKVRLAGHQRVIPDL